MKERRQHAFFPPAECPVCGAVVPRTAQACPGCGADERTGWDEEKTRHDGLDLPDWAFDEAPARPSRPAGVLWTAVAVVTLAAVIAVLIRR